MKSFGLLSDDKIYEICESLDDRSLSNLIKSHSRIYSICLPILKKRRLNDYLDNILNLSAVINSTNDRKQQIFDYIQLFNYVRGNKELLDLIYESGDEYIKEFINTMIDNWEKLRYDYDLTEMEQFRPFISELNRKYKINRKLYRYPTQRFSII